MTPDEKAIFHAAIKLLDTFTKYEARLLGSLMLAYPGSLSIQQLALLSPTHRYLDNPQKAIRVHIHRLREKLPSEMVVKTVEYGYKLEYTDAST